jgi:hypothetical protein
MSFLSNLLTAAIAFVASGFNPWVAAAAFAAGTYGDMDARRRQRNARNNYNESVKDRYQMVRGATEPRKIVYGRARVSGPMLFVHSTGDKKQFLHVIVALAGHECDAIESVMLNDVVLPAPNATTGMIESGVYAVARETSKSVSVGATAGAAFSITIPLAAGETLARVNGVTRRMSYGGNSQHVNQAYTLAGNVISGVAGDGNGSLTVDSIAVAYTVGSSTPRVRVRTHLGTATGAQPFPELVAESDGKWTAAHQLNGITAVYLRLEYDQDVFGQTGLPNISAVVRGKKIRDARTGLTAWSDNAALCMADYLRDADHGMAASAAEVPDAEIIEAANICAEPVALDLAGATQARYTCNGTLGTDVPRRGHLDTLADTMGMRAPVWSQGRWLVRAGAHRTASLTITESMLADTAPVIQPWAPRRDLINRVLPTYAAADQLYTEVQAPAVTNALYLADDGGIDLPLETTYAMCTDAMRAQRLAKIELERTRQAMVVQLSCNLKAYDLSPTDIVALTLPRYGFSGKLFEVVSRTLDVQQWTVQLVLRETAAGVWDWAYGEATAVDLTPNTTLPSPFTLPAVLTGLTADSGTEHLQMAADGTIVTRALLTWTQSTDVFVTQGGRVQVQWRSADATTWQDAPDTTGDSISAYIGPLSDGGVIYIRVRPLNSLRRAGDWTVISHTVVGKIAPPPDVSAFTVSEQPNGGRSYYWDITSPPLDLAGFLARYSEGTTVRPWASMVPLFEAGGPERSRALAMPADGEHWIAIKAIDTSGHESASARYLQAVFDASGFGTAYLVVDPTALGWPGTRVACALDGYVLVDIGSSTWDTAALTWDTWSAWTTGSSGSISYEHTVIDATTSASTRLRTSDVSGGTGLTEYASSVDNITYTAWAPVPTGPITGRYFKVRWTVTGGSPVLYRAAVTLYR